MILRTLFQSYHCRFEKNCINALRKPENSDYPLDKGFNYKRGINLLNNVRQLFYLIFIIG
jgi:hypothetical protein